MEVPSVNKVKRIDFTSMPNCKPCKPALKKIRKIAKKHNIPLNVSKDGMVAPVACIVKDKDGVEVSNCIKGYGKRYKKDIERLIEE